MHADYKVHLGVIGINVMTNIMAFGFAKIQYNLGPKTELCGTPH
jgi:hypothetical protein